MFQEVVNWVVDFVSINLRHSIVATLLPELCFLTTDVRTTRPEVFGPCSQSKSVVAFREVGVDCD